MKLKFIVISKIINCKEKLCKKMFFNNLLSYIEMKDAFENQNQNTSDLDENSKDNRSSQK